MPRTKVKATMDACMLPPGERYNFMLAKPPNFMGQHIINKGDVHGLMIAYVFIGQNNQLMYEIPLLTTECVLEVCPAALDLTVGIRNNSKEPRRVSFEILGRVLDRLPEDSPWRLGHYLLGR